MTPLQMGIMLAAHIGNGKPDFSPSFTPTYQNQVTDLMNAGYIISNTEAPPAYGWKLTDKGRTWLNAALVTPEPIKEVKWIIPK